MSLFSRLKKWLSDKKIIRLKILADNNNNYCPLCLSDLDTTEGGTVISCPTCKAKIYIS